MQSWSANLPLRTKFSSTRKKSILSGVAPKKVEFDKCENLKLSTLSKSDHKFFLKLTLSRSFFPFFRCVARDGRFWEKLQLWTSWKALFLDKRGDKRLSVCVKKFLVKAAARDINCLLLPLRDNMKVVPKKYHSVHRVTPKFYPNFHLILSKTQNEYGVLFIQIRSILTIWYVSLIIFYMKMFILYFVHIYVHILFILGQLKSIRIWANFRLEKFNFEVNKIFKNILFSWPYFVHSVISNRRKID